MHEDDIVGQTPRLPEIMGDEHDLDAAPMRRAVTICSIISKWRPGSRLAVGSSRNSTSGCGRQRAAQRKPLLLAAREQARRLALTLGQPDHLQYFAPPRLVCPTAQTEHKVDIRRHRPAQQNRALEHHRLRMRTARLIGCPPHRISPELGGISPCSRRTSRLLPAPFGPMITLRLSAARLRSTPSTSVVPSAERSGRARGTTRRVSAAWLARRHPASCGRRLKHRRASSRCRAATSPRRSRQSRSASAPRRAPARARVRPFAFPARWSWSSRA